MFLGSIPSRWLVPAAMGAAIAAQAAPLMQAPSRVAQSPYEVQPILAGQGIPSARLQNADSRILSLKVEVLRKPALLVFVGGSDEPGASERLRELANLAPQLVALGYRVIAVSADGPGELKKLLARDVPELILLSDREMDAAEHFGVAYRPRAARDAAAERMVPSVFVVSAGGAIVFESVNPDSKAPLKSEVLLAAARAYAVKP